DRASPERAKIEPWRLNRLPRCVLLQRRQSPGLRASVYEVKKCTGPILPTKHGVEIENRVARIEVAWIAHAGPEIGEVQVRIAVEPRRLTELPIPHRGKEQLRVGLQRHRGCEREERAQGYTWCNNILKPEAIGPRAV